MAHYIMDLPGNINVDVRKGKLFKKRAGFLNQWPWIKISSEVRTGYIVTVENVLHKNKTEYHLVKTKAGKWLAGEDHELSPAIKIRGKWHPLADDLITLAIKKAIDDYENKQ
jgi:hypothetical protein